MEAGKRSGRGVEKYPMRLSRSYFPVSHRDSPVYDSVADIG